MAMLSRRWSQRARLSPIQFAAYRWMPAKPARESTKVRSSGIASRSPAVVAMAISSAYWLR